MKTCKKYSACASAIGSLLVLCLLSGCAGLNSGFSCPMKPGQLCNSLDQVNTLVDQGKIGSDASAANSSATNHTVSAIADKDSVMPYPLPALKVGDPLRYGESVMRIWVAPYEDKAGNYYQPTILYSVVHPGHWIGDPVSTVTNDD